MSVLDTNVYATAPQTLSCKIDKTSPTLRVTSSSSGSGYHYWNAVFSDTGGSGLAKWTGITSSHTNGAIWRGSGSAGNVTNSRYLF